MGVPDRRHTDINVWEKRITLWFMATLVAVATDQVVENEHKRETDQKGY